MNVSETLLAMADLLEPEGAWTQEVLQRDRNGKPIDNNQSAVCWCMLGAAYKIGWSKEAWSVLCDKLDGSPIAWNDAPDRTQAEVVAMLREAAREHA